MKESQSQRRLLVTFDGDSAPHVIVPRSQAEQLRKLFEKREISFSLNTRGQKDFAVFELGRDVDIRVVQSVLDSVK